MKVTVLRPPPLDPEDTTPPPGRVLRLHGDADGFSIDSEPRRPWSAARFLCLHQVDPTAGNGGLMLIVDGRRRPLELGASTLEGPAFEGASDDATKLAMCWARQSSGVMIDRATFAAMRGSPIEPMHADARIYAAAVQRALANASAAPKASSATSPAPAVSPGLSTSATATAAARAATPKSTLTPPVSRTTGSEAPGVAATPEADEPAEHCPHCLHPRTAAKAKCERCGVLFAKLGKEPMPARLTPAEHDEDQDEDEDILGLPPAASRQADQRAAESFLSADSLVAKLINLAREHGTSLFWLAASVVTTWLLVGIGLLWLADPGPLRGVLLITIAAGAYSHAVSSLTFALHAAARGQAWTHGATWTRGARRLTRLLPARLISLVPIVLGFAAFLVPGFVFSLRSVFLEVVGTVEDNPPMGISWDQVSSNLSEGFRFSVGAQVALAALTALALGLVPACMVGIGATLELIDVVAWLTPSIAMVVPLVLLIAWLAASLSLWAMVLYLLFQELQDRQGAAMWTSPSGLTTLIKIVLLVDLFMLLVVLIRASRLAG